jgi:hypothetical protein
MKAKSCQRTGYGHIETGNKEAGADIILALNIRKPNFMNRIHGTLN